MKKKEMKGLRFGRLLVLSEGPRSPKTRRVMWNCICDCGNLKLADGVYLRSGHVKSCGCLVRDSIGERTRTKDSGFNKLYRNYKRSAKNRGYSFDIRKEVFKEMTSSDCFYCGEAPRSVSIKQSDYGAYTFNGLDRLVNELGYSEANCVPCCESCNFLKRALHVEDFLIKIEAIYNNLNRTRVGCGLYQQGKKGGAIKR